MWYTNTNSGVALERIGHVKKRKLTIGSVLASLLGLACALVLGAVFYGAMAYQLTGEEEPSLQAQMEATPAPLSPGLSGAALYPGPLLALSGAQMTGERARDEDFGGKTCRVIERTYLLPSGMQAAAVSAYPAAYLERMVLEAYEAQLITGFSLAGMDAVYALKEENALLCARDGERVYMIETQADEQAVYALGVSAYLE